MHFLFFVGCSNLQHCSLCLQLNFFFVVQNFNIALNKVDFIGAIRLWLMTNKLMVMAPIKSTLFKAILNFFISCSCLSVINNFAASFVFPHHSLKIVLNVFLYNGAIKPVKFNCNVHNLPQNKFKAKFLFDNLVIMAINQILII